LDNRFNINVRYKQTEILKVFGDFAKQNPRKPYKSNTSLQPGRVLAGFCHAKTSENHYTNHYLSKTQVYRLSISNPLIILLKKYMLHF
jgi:hypothetical protein